jgi:hypothetical protein
MSTSCNLTSKPKSRALTSVRILTWLAVAFFLIVYFLVPMEITVSWSMYFILFGPVFAVDLAAIIGFIICRVMHQKISFAYLLISLVVMGGVWYVTWFELRLRWYEVFGA